MTYEAVKDEWRAELVTVVEDELWGCDFEFESHHDVAERVVNAILVRTFEHLICARALP